MLGKMDCFGMSDTGRVRATNEDQFLIASLSKSMQVHSTSLQLDDQTRLFGSSQGRLLLVADGMGGQAAGRRASTLALDSLVTYILNTMHWFFRLREDSEEQFLDELKAALGYAQERIIAEGERLPERHGMGTTLTMAYLVWPRLYVLHAGDSRCYLWRHARLKQLTHDQTVAQQLAEAGALPDAAESRWSHVLWNVVGGESGELHPELHRAGLAIGDALLLCTDGLTRYVADAELTKILASSPTAKDACRRLIEAANAAGGADNITAIVAYFRDSAQQLHAAHAVAERSAEAPATERVPVPAVEGGELVG